MISPDLSISNSGYMPELFHYCLCPQSRFARLALAEYGVEAKLTEERVRERRHDFLLLNPAGEVPVLVLDDGAAICGAATIAEWLDETHGEQRGTRRLMPAKPEARAETRRLVDWFTRKFFAEVSDPIVTEKVYRRFTPPALGGGGPDMDRIRFGRANIRPHLRYMGWLVASRYWLAGEALSLADLAAAAHLSSMDYLGDVPWDEDAAAKDWYQRMKSRPALRALLAERLPRIVPPDHYGNPDF